MTNINQIFEARGFSLVQTGGGCVAWRFERRRGGHILVTDVGGGNVPESESDTLLIGQYDNDDHEGVCQEMTLIEFQLAFNSMSDAETK